DAPPAIECFVGAAMKPAFEEAVARFEAKTGNRVEIHFGGSGKMLADMTLSGRGDVYFPGSDDFMTAAIERGVVDPETLQTVVYLVPAVLVRSGNPMGIRSLSDLGNPGVRIGLGRPDTVCLGRYAIEILETAGLFGEVEKNIATYVESCAKIVQVLEARNVDAVIGWRVFQSWRREGLEFVPLEPAQIPRVSYAPAGVCRESRNRPGAMALVRFLGSEEGKAIFRKWGYRVGEQEVRRLAPAAKVGGQPAVRKAWRKF
ncbi:MAG: molybdate ABC transporter substrate-binding protein, partial [Planctomycetota bacterium]